MLVNASSVFPSKHSDPRPEELATAAFDPTGSTRSSKLARRPLPALARRRPATASVVSLAAFVDAAAGLHAWSCAAVAYSGTGRSLDRFTPLLRSALALATATLPSKDARLGALAAPPPCGLGLVGRAAPLSRARARGAARLLVRGSQGAARCGFHRLVPALGKLLNSTTARFEPLLAIRRYVCPGG